MIQLLWPTIRPDVMKSTWRHWMDHAARPDDIRLKIAVNTQDHRDALREFPDALVLGDDRRGASAAAYALFKALEADPRDIVVFGADDIFAPPGWDEWLRSQFADYDGAIVVNDGGQYGPCVTQPILTFACVLRMNRAVIHPAYRHFYADAELYANLSEMGALRDLRATSPLFEHRNWAWGKREKDAYDTANTDAWGRDCENYEARMRMPLAERLKVDEVIA